MVLGKKHVAFEKSILELFLYYK